MTRTQENRQLQTMNARSVIRFEFRDAKGRQIGAQVATWNAVMEAREHGRSTLAPGPAFGLNVMQTRSGIPYGASQPDQWFATLAERDAAIAAYLDGARKRCAKRDDLTATA